MDGVREVKVRLVADVAEYSKAMKRAEKRARKLAAALRDVDRVTIRVNVERSSSS
jgi:hypothetical protein